MRGIAIGTVLAFVFWSFAAWCFIGACAWLHLAWDRTSPMTLGVSLACIVVAAFTAAAWSFSVGRGGRQADDLLLDPSTQD